MFKLSYPSSIENREDFVDEQEMENYLVSVIALQKLMQAELSLMIDIIPNKHYHQVFQIIIQESLSNIVHEGEVLIHIYIENIKCITNKIIKDKWLA